MLRRMNAEKFSILFVCMGNICRSPSAEGVFGHLLAQSPLSERIEIDSAGTVAHHVGEAPDRRSQAAALKRGIDLSRLRARQVQRSDFDAFDLILAMDRDNLDSMQRICPPQLANKLELFLHYAHEYEETEVPDPYYGGHDGFEHVLDLIEAASGGLLRALQDDGRLGRATSKAQAE